MGSPLTLDPGPTWPPDPHCQAVTGDSQLLEHLQTPAAVGGHEFAGWPLDQIASGFGGDLDARHRHDHTRLPNQFPHTHPDLPRDAVRDAERAFDRLNPDYGVPADQRSRYGRQAVREREAALTLGAGWPSTTAARTTATRSSGSPARTIAWPTPSRRPMPSPPGPGTGRSGWAPNAESARARST
jgi:hypothetical protein